MLPKRIALGVLGTLVVGACFQVASYVEAKTTTAAEIAALQKNDIESRARGDDLRRKIEALPSIQIQIARMEERQRAQDEVLKEIRDLARRAQK